MDNLDVTNLYLAFRRSAEKYAERPALKADGGRGRTYTYAEVNRLVRRLAVGLSEGNYADIKEIGLLSENRPEWVISYLAILASGKTVLPIDANLKVNEIGYIIEHAGLRLVLTSPKFENVLAGVSSDIEIYSFGPNSLRDWQRLSGEETAYDEKHLAGLHDPAAMIYTSGTTGNPKAVVLTHDNLLGNLESIRRTLKFTTDDIFISVLPLHHTFEAMCGFLVPITSGASIVYVRSLKSNEIREDIAFNRGTHMCGVPLLFEKMYRNIKRRIEEIPLLDRLLFKSTYFISSLTWKLSGGIGRALLRKVRRKAGLDTIRMFVCGGAPLPPEIARFFNYLGFIFLQGYGLSECSPVVAVNLPDNIVFGSVGPPVEKVEVKIIEQTEDGIGEIIVRGRNITPGYKNNPVETGKLLKDGWLYTGDLGFIKNGNIWITGRKKNLIVSAAGKNIYPEELEERLMVSEFIAETVVFGRTKDAKQGEEVRAIIVPDLEQFRAQYDILPENPDMGVVRNKINEIVESVNSEVAAYKRISGFEIQLEELEKTSSKKIKRYYYS
ncbi:MAG: AMP-dependent synthetase/ligase [Candidatus Zixiibacteriota bacterium]